MEAEFLQLMPATVLVAPFASQDQFGAAAYGADVSYQCRISIRDEYVRSKDGREIAARGKIYLPVTSAAAFTTRDRVTMPAGYVPANPPILDVQPEQDETGVHHVVLVIG